MTNHVDVDAYNKNDGGYDCLTKLAILPVILVLGIVAFVIGIWAAICCCLLTPCTCCTQQQASNLKGPRKRGNIVAETLLFP